MSTVEKHSFQAEIQQVLDIVIHSLYTDREIFVRELISNASDACEKLRFAQTSGQPIRQADVPLTIAVSTDEKENTFTIVDTGSGMSQADLVENLGTIAHSGTKSFLNAVKAQEGQKLDANLIGQFGVGFYSAFMVAKKVTVYTRSFHPDSEGWKWTSEGMGGYEMEPAGDLPRGTKIVLDLKDEAKAFAIATDIENIIRRYSNFVQFPIELNGKRLNNVQAIWARNKNEIKPEEYNEFYHYIGHDHQDPLLRLHFSADAPLAIQALLFVPSHSLETLGFARMESEVHLYCRKVLIQHKAKGLLPEWLRFLRGVVDSEDLPLNISRETMQDSSLLQKLNKVLTKRFIKFLEETSEKEPETFATFYKEYNRFIKEGVVTDFAYREELGKLLRFESSTLDKGQLTSLADYVKRMPSDQKEIYYLLAPNRDAAISSPYYEVFAARHCEVLFLYDAWDEFVMENLHQFDSKPLKTAEKAELKIEQPSAAERLSEEQSKVLAQWLKEKLGDQVKEVRVSDRLVDSPAIVVESDRMMTTSMRRMLKAMKKDDVEPALYDLEINPGHPVINRLEAMRQDNSELAGKVAEQIYDNARVAAGVMEDPRAMLKRMNELLAEVLKPGTGAPKS